MNTHNICFCDEIKQFFCEAMCMKLLPYHESKTSLHYILSQTELA